MDASIPLEVSECLILFPQATEYTIFSGKQILDPKAGRHARFNLIYSEQ